MDNEYRKSTTDKLLDGLLKLCEVISVGLLVILVTCTVLQVFCRFILGSALVWSEEVSRFAGIWMVILSTAIAIQKRSHMTIDLLTGKLSEKIQRFCKAFSDLVILLVCVCMMYFGAIMTSMFMGTPAPATHVSMGLIYAGVVAGWVCSTIAAGAVFVKSLQEALGKGGANA